MPQSTAIYARISVIEIVGTIGNNFTHRWWKIFTVWWCCGRFIAQHDKICFESGADIAVSSELIFAVVTKVFVRTHTPTQSFWKGAGLILPSLTTLGMSFSVLSCGRSLSVHPVHFRSLSPEIIEKIQSPRREAFLRA